MKKAMSKLPIVLLVCLLSLVNNNLYSQTPARTKAINTIQDSLPDNNTKLITPSRLRYTLYRMLDATKDSVPIIDIINLQKNTANGIAGLDGAGKVLTSQLPAETDPTVPSHVKAISTTNISNWNAAFGWGNHASAGYLVPIITSPINGQVLKYISGAWRNSSASTSPDSTTASNGLSLVGKDVELGGNLLFPTAIGGAFSFTLQNKSFLAVPTDTVFLQPSGALSNYIRLSASGGTEISSGDLTHIYGGATVSGRLDLSAASAPITVPNMSSDPLSGVNGDIYYNTATNKFRKYENFAWKDLVIIGDAVADGTTKGQATFIATDFNSSGGVISLDYSNMQVGSGSVNGIITPTLYNLFNPTYNNGLTRTGDITQLGGPLVQATTVSSAVGARTIAFTGVTEFGDSPYGFFRILNTGTGNALNVQNTGGAAAIAANSSGVALLATGSTSAQLSGVMTVGDAQENPVLQSTVSFTRTTTTTNNNITPILNIKRRTTDAGGGVIGMGSSIKFTGQFASNSNEGEQASIYSKWLDPVSGTTDADFGIATTQAGTPSEKLYISNLGALKFNKYGINTFAGTPAYGLGVDASGNVVEYTAGTGTLSGANEGLSVSGSNAQLGGSFTTDRTLTASGSSRINLTGAGVAGGFGLMNVTSTGNFAYTILGTASGSNSTAVRGVNSVATAVSGQGFPGGAFGTTGANAQGLIANAFDSTSIPLQVINATGNTGSGTRPTLLMELRRETSGGIVGGNGIAGIMEFTFPRWATDGSSSGYRSYGEIETNLVDYNGANVQSEMIFRGVGDSITNNLVTFNGLGPVTLHKYGAGTITGTATKLLAVTSAGKIIEASLAGGVTASSGLSMSGTDVRLGGSSISGNAVITSAGNATDRITINGTSTTAWAPLIISDNGTGSGLIILEANASANAVDIQHSGSGGRGLSASAINGVGIVGSDGGTGIGVGAQSTTGIPLSAAQNTSSNTATTGLRLIRNNGSSPGGTGLGNDILWQIEDNAGPGVAANAGKISTYWTDATAGSENSSMDFWTNNNGTFDSKLSIKDNGQLQATKYGVNTFTGTLAYALGVTSAGNVIEYTPSTASGANPSASVGLTAVNGSAGTFMRSDGAPALDQSIAPTWTGAHTFTSTGSLLVPTLGIKNSGPLIDLWNTSSASSNQKRWGLSVTSTGGVFQLRAYDDDGTTGNSGIAMQIFRNGSAAQDMHLLNVSGTSQVKIDVTNGVTIDKLVGTGTRSVQTTSAGILQAGPVLASGTWTPTLTGVANVDGTPTSLHATYIRMGSIVKCQLTLSIDPTANTTQTEVGISLPIASAFTGSNDASGEGAGSTGNGVAQYVQVVSDATNDRATVIFQSGSTSASIVTLTFQYTIL